VEAARAALAHVLEEERRGSSRAPAAAVPLELLERLGALGYTGGVAPAQTSTPGADPKDRIEDFRLASQFIREGLLRLNAKDYAGSAERFEALRRRGISSFEVHFFLARALLGARRMREADRQFEEATRLGPGYAAAWKGLAESRVALNDRNGALAALRRGEAAVPGNAELRLAEARLLKVIGRSEEACRAYESAAALAPKSAEVRAELGDLLRDLGAIADALKWQREAVDLEPRGAYYWSTLGMTLGGNGRLAEAEKAFREAWRLDATDHRNAYNLGLILLRQERPGDARPFFEKALQLEPSFTPASQKLTELGPPKK
jgi:tetratricopeptide (TPR) repeat protein